MKPTQLPLRRPAPLMSPAERLLAELRSRAESKSGTDDLRCLTA